MAHECRIHVDRDQVQIIMDGRLIAELPWQAAIELGRGLIRKGHEAEEYAKAGLIIVDQALLLRVGAPFGVTTHPELQAEVAKEAAWNRELRRALPGGIRSQAHVGTPSFNQTPIGLKLFAWQLFQQLDIRSNWLISRSQFHKRSMAMNVPASIRQVLTMFRPVFSSPMLH